MHAAQFRNRHEAAQVIQVHFHDAFLASRFKP
jgi:hypothetical protein